MSWDDQQPPSPLLDSQSSPLKQGHWAFGQALSISVGMVAAVLRHGFYRITGQFNWELGNLVILSMLCYAGVTFFWLWRSGFRRRFFREHLIPIGVASAWLIGGLFVWLLTPASIEAAADRYTLLDPYWEWTELWVFLLGLVYLVLLIRWGTARKGNPSVMLAVSFLALIAVGTLLLMLPRARAPELALESNEGAPFLVALFTSTSACCVTGLVVVHTGQYWSTWGQSVIMILFQLGGLGIMTFGSFFALVAGRKMRIRERVTMQGLLEAEQLGEVRHLVSAILLVTLGAELLGAVLISGLFSDMPWHQCCFWSLFHSVSAFCNAGFSLTENSLVGMGDRWQVWGVITMLIVLGGLGFSVLYNVALRFLADWRLFKNRQRLFRLPARRVRLTLSSQIVLLMTGSLLVLGTLVLYGLERYAHASHSGEALSFVDAWFQSVTMRTAGFNTVDLDGLQTSSKLFSVLLMFIGASPGSTGGGVKTVSFGLAILALVSVIRGRDKVEFFGRTIPAVQVSRALAIIFLAVMTLLLSTMLLVAIEGVDLSLADAMFEAASACGTVGVSTGITPSLSAASQVMLIVTMFLGRVGPLTFVVALIRSSAPARFDYPEERVTLG